MRFQRKRAVAVIAPATDPPIIPVKPDIAYTPEPRALHVDVSAELYARRAEFEENPVIVTMTEPAADGTIEMVFTSIESARWLTSEIRNLNAEIARERAAHERTKGSMCEYVEQTEGVKQDVTALDNAIGFALGALLTLDGAIGQRKLGRGPVPLAEEIQQGLRAIGRSLKPHAPKFLPSVPLGNLIETPQIRRWTVAERAAREKIAALPPTERAALQAAAETSDVAELDEADRLAISQATQEGRSP